MILTSGQIVSRPILLGDNDEATGGPIKATCTPALVVGIKDVSSDHYVTSSITGKTAYRTLGNARLALPADAWDVGGQQLAIEFIVEQNTPATGQVGLFGFERQQKPSPWYCAVVDGKFEFRYAAADGTIPNFLVPWPAGIVAGKVTLGSGTCSITLNGQSQSFNAPSGLAPRDTAYFGVGGLADRAYGWGDYVGGAQDWTYHALKVTAGVSSGIQANESATTPFCRLLCDQPGPVACYGLFGHTFGFMLDADPAVLATLNRKNCRIHDLTISSGVSVGPLIAVGGIYNLTFERLVTTVGSGGQSIASIGGLFTYPVRLTDCSLGANYFGQNQTIWGARNDFQTCGAEFHYCFVSLRDTFVAGNPKGGTMLKLRDGAIASFDVGQADYEGLQPTAYFDFDTSCSVKVSNWYKGKNTPIVVP